MADISVANTSSDLSGKTVLTAEGTYTQTGPITFDRDPNPPFVVTSGSAVVPNLDADKVDGLDSSYLLAFANQTGTVALASQVSGNLPLSNLGTFVFTSYTPTWGNTGTANTLGNGSVAGAYLQVGKLVLFFISLTWGSTTASGNGTWTFTLPVTGSSTYAAGSVNDAQYADSSASQTYRGSVGNVSTSVIFPYTNASPMAAVTALAPFTWATGDSCIIRGWYVAA